MIMYASSANLIITLLAWTGWRSDSLTMNKASPNSNSALDCVHTDTSMSISTSPGFRLQLVEASLVQVEHSRSLVQAHN